VFRWVIHNLVPTGKWIGQLIRVFTGCIYMYVAAASPNRASLGATNGIAQFLVSITRVIGPAASTSLFSLSMAEDYLGGGLVYIVLLMASLATIALGTTLPRQVW
jgi:hypothetical protein